MDRQAGRQAGWTRTDRAKERQKFVKGEKATRTESGRILEERKKRKEKRSEIKVVEEQHRKEGEKEPWRMMCSKYVVCSTCLQQQS